ncbi:Hypothetical_protein [Hexamita inflata]|uniref:Hypothetical_protein n=1 Tax=Hexamita inflata TaxID=28002 RepID=A0AA86PTU2_9EUKA|nr:Hypothetical protein HINF_LOCUS33845 [Hexamita inflata]
MQSLLSKTPILQESDLTMCRLAFNYSDSDDSLYDIQIQLGSILDKASRQRISLSTFPLIFEPNKLAQLKVDFNDSLTAEKFLRLNKIATEKFTLLGKLQRTIKIGDTLNAKIVNSQKISIEEELFCSNITQDYRFVVRRVQESPLVGEKEVIQTVKTFSHQIEQEQFTIEFVLQKFEKEMDHFVFIRPNNQIRDQEPQKIQQMILGLGKIVQMLIM